jgi:hypothetical protein
MSMANEDSMTMKKRACSFALFVAALAFAGTASAASGGSIRCGGHLLTGEDRRGPTQYEVLKKCGEPTVRQSSIWIYDRPGRPKKILYFDGGRLERIEG